MIRFAPLNPQTVGPRRVNDRLHFSAPRQGGFHPARE